MDWRSLPVLGHNLMEVAPSIALTKQKADIVFMDIYICGYQFIYIVSMDVYIYIYIYTIK